MTPPSLTVAREILTDAAAKARTSGDPVAELAAAAIDVVLAELDARPSVHGAASVITVSTPAAATAPTAILIGRIPGVRQILSREDAREAFGRQDGDAVWDAFGRAPPPVFIATAREASSARPGWEAFESPAMEPPSAERVAALRAAADRVERAEPPAATAHGTAIPPEATADEMLPCPFCRSTTLSVGKPPGGAFPILDRPYVSCTACGARGPLARSDADREVIANWNRRPEPRERGLAAAPAGVQRCGTCGAALPLSPGRPGCAECHA